ncbi:SubName: Full=Uncharacterized protein {ECO:0000313/EMBL:CCA75650.1} [Serendipita indica DSM 11827]|nr:SubName: Full=Uncharacterized protein {ECO:0000313/EMBL:CCA75650.1} [Serendipita indica DSM 11827]
MKVIVFGSTGFIGLPVAHALVRNGHQVYGVSRSEKNAQLMRANEIIPLIGDIFDPATWEKHLVDADVVVDCAAGDIATNARRLFQVVTSSAARIRPGNRGTYSKLAYIYTSGTWVHGEERSQLRSDTSLPTPPLLVAWRPAVEDQVVKSEIVRGIVIRPSLVYGRQGSLFSSLFAQATPSVEKLEWFGTPGGSYALVHVDDLADCFLRAVKKNHLISGLILDCTNERTESVDGILYAFATVVGVSLDKVTYRPPANVLEEAMAVTF